MSARKTYVGDGVYVELDEFGSVILTTENGIRATNRIVLEPEIWSALRSWVTRAIDAMADTEAPQPIATPPEGS